VHSFFYKKHKLVILIALSLWLLVVVFFRSLLVQDIISFKRRRQSLTGFQQTSIPAINSVNSTPAPSSISILFTGDLMFDRNIRLASQKYGYDYPLTPLTAFLNQFELVVVNLEGPITNNPSRSVGSTPGSTENYLFTIDPQIIDQVLLKNRINLVNLGNNHILNFGVDGYQQTITYLTAAKIDFFGQVNLPIDHTSQEVEQSEKLSHIWSSSNLKIAFVNFNQFANLGIEPVLLEIRQLRDQVDVIFAYVHWGIEYAPIANATIENWGRQLIDAGADAVIGTHPHVIQNVTEYHGKKIYYSLGNFVFDQYFQPEVKVGLLVEAKITNDQINQPQLEFVEYRVQMSTDGQTSLVELTED
jgi:poly-gamma-glutamate synthesis protein (capsule biosynthesis protein)